MLRQPSQSSTMSLPTTVISGLMIAIGSDPARVPRPRRRRARRRTSAALRAPAARPGRRRGTRPSCRSCRRSASERRRLSDLGPLERPRLRAQHRMPHARDFQNRHDPRIILARVDVLHPHDDSHAYRFCPRCGGALERRLLKATEPERLVCTRCGFVFYLDPKIAVGTIIATAIRAASCSCGARSSRATASGCFPAATSIAANR